MMRRMRLAIAGGLLALGLWLAAPSPAMAQDYNMDRFFYYPYYYFPHNYWPSTSPTWPERPGQPYVKPPAYMAYPAFEAPYFHYPLTQKMSYYRGFHFWLDQF